MTPIRLPLALALLLVLIVAIAASRAEASPGLAAVWAVDDGEKVFRDDLDHPLKSGGAGNSVWDGATVGLFAARNEIVAFQLILEADAGGAQDVNVVVSDVTDGAATIRGSHPLPEPNSYLGLGVELFTEHYLHLTEPSYNDPIWGGFYTTWEANPKITGWIPDALVPFSAAAGKGGAPFDIPAGTNQGVWVDIYVADGLPAGIYTGTIQVTLGGAPAAEIPLELEVLELALPDENHYRSMLFYSDYSIRPRHNLTWGAELWEMLRHYNRMAHRHRLELIGIGSWDEIANLEGTITGEAFTAAHGYEGPGEGVGNTLFSVHTYGWSFGENETEYRDNSDMWVNWFDANAPDVEYFLYLIDEPSSDMYAWVAERAGWIHNNPGPGSRLPVFMTRAPISELIGSIDIWCTQAPWYYPSDVAAARARGERVWLYAGNRPQTPMDVIDEYGVALRLKPWVAYKCDIRRWFTWETSHWEPNNNEVPNDVSKNPWADPLTFYAGYDGSRGHGDGTMFYPGEDYVFPEENREYPGPISSIRMKMYRRGIQDYEYMWLAEQLGFGTEVGTILDGLLPHVMWDALPVPDWSNSNAVYEQARRQLADLVVGGTRFPDVAVGHWAFWEVEACAEAGIVAGYADGLYRPTNPVTRDQMAVYISRALAGGDENVPEFAGTPTFPDVPEGFWALDYVEYAAAQNVVAGYGDGTYHPEYEVTRDQMAVYVARALVAPTGEAALADYVPADPRNFPDVASGFWAYTHVEYCVENGVVAGYLDGLYHPEIVVTRDQMAVYVARAFGLLE
jgi:hypothetical protein